MTIGNTDVRVLAEANRPDTPIIEASWAHRMTTVARTTRHQLGLVPLGWWLWPLMVAITLVWSILIANQILSLGRQPALNWVIVRTLAELQAVPGFLAAAVVLIDDVGRSRRSSALAMPWPGMVFMVRLVVAAGLAWAWAMIEAGLITLVLPLFVHTLAATNTLTATDAFVLMPIYMALFTLVAGSLARLIGKFVPAAIATVGGLGVLLPMFAIVIPAARYLPSVVGLPPVISFNPAVMVPQPTGLAILTTWAIGLTALALWKTTRQDC